MRHTFQPSRYVCESVLLCQVELVDESLYGKSSVASAIANSVLRVTLSVDGCLSMGTPMTPLLSSSYMIPAPTNLGRCKLGNAI